MKFDITPSVHVGRDQNGKVRQLRHLQKPYTAAAAGLAAAGTVTPRALAEQYLRDVAKIYDMPATATANFAAAPGGIATQEPTQLRFQEEKSVENNTTVSYSQTLYGLPVWDQPFQHGNLSIYWGAITSYITICVRGKDATSTQTAQA